MDGLLRAVEANDPDWVGKELAALPLASVYAGAQGAVVRRKILATLLDLNMRLSCPMADYHGRLLDKAGGCPAVLCELLKMLPRDRAREYVERECECACAMSVLALLDYRKDRTLYLACLNSLKRAEVVAQYELLRANERHLSEHLLDIVAAGLVDIAVVQTLLVVFTDLAAAAVFQSWADNSREADAPAQLYQAVVVCSLLGNTPLQLDDPKTGWLFDGIQQRLGSCDAEVQMVARVIAELLSRAVPVEDPITKETRRVDMKVDFAQPTAGLLLAAFRHAGLIDGLLAVQHSRPIVLFEGSFKEAKAAKKVKELEEPREAMAKNDPNRVRGYLADILQALDEHDKPARRAAAIDTLLKVTMTCGEVELRDFGARLVDAISLVGDLHHLPDCDNKLLACRIMACLRMPELMVDRAVGVVFGRQIGLFDKVNMLTSIVRACQVAVNRLPIDDSLQQYIDCCDGAARCRPESIATRFIDGCVVKGRSRCKYLSAHDGLIGERLLLAMATMLPAVPAMEYGRVAVLVAEMVRSFVVERMGCPKAIKRGGLVALTAIASYLPDNCGAVARLVVAMDATLQAGLGDASEDIRSLSLNLAGLLKEKLTVESVIMEALLLEEQGPRAGGKEILLPF